MKSHHLSIFILLLSLVSLPHSLYPSHMRAAEISVERVSCESLTVKITITAYLNTNSGVAFGGNTGDLEFLYFGDGHKIRVPEILTTPRPDLGVDVGVAQFTIEHTYSSPGIYEISYGEANRNEGVLNISGSSNQSLFVKTQIHFAPSDCNHFPELLIPPVDRGCSGVAFFHSIGVYDADGDSLSYELVIPIGNNGQPAQYKSPADPSFYNQYLNEEGTGPVVFSINPITGLLTWDAAGVQGEYNIAIKITEWRNDPETGEPIIMSSIIRDMQIIIEDCNNNRPDVIIPQDTCIVAGSMLDLTIYGTDQDQHPVKIETYSEVFELSPESIPATYSPDPFETRPSNPPAELAFNWNTSCSHVRDRPYQVVFKITDQPPVGTKLVTYKTWNIKVVAPKPVWQNIVPDLVNRHAQLNWENYTCDNAQSVQIWRRVDEFNYDADNCGGESLSSMGYELLAEVDPTTVQYLDTNGGRKLSVGAKYCYRLVAKMPNGSFSLISEELCIDPILVDAPVITHVTVETTSYKDGKIRISWRSPFEISKVQYPGPYQYEVYRGDGLDYSELLTAVGRMTDTTFVDVGLNTEEKVYHYVIVLYSKTINNSSYSPVDTSLTASSIKLITMPGAQSVSLKWNTNVPWSNYSQSYPRHLIYRGEYGTPENQLTLIDSVDVLQQGLNYVDLGNYQNTPLSENKFYCYKVMTRGVYGNPKISEPLENFSPMICSYPTNDLPVCSPSVSVIKPDCELFLSTATCGPYDLANTIYWEPPKSTACRLDVKSYSIYASSGLHDEYKLIASDVRDTFYIESNLSSQARCYRVTTTDGLGRTSDMSDPVCNDNCVYYELPNVFTPNGDGCNDRFSAYYDQDEGNGEEAPCPIVDTQKCPRFVQQVSFKVYNRWGKLVYNRIYDNDQSIYINWDGRDNQGKELASAVYYYEAKVKFDAIDPGKQNQTIKGWVHLIR